VTVIHIADHETEPFTFLMPSVRLTGIWLPDADVTPEQYLRYAELDLEDTTDRGAINALGNAKRALHLIVDTLLQGYGLLARNHKAGFPQKLELIDAAGLFSLSILGTLNLERNVMEHEYRAPARARVEEMVDVGRLLLLATHRMGEQVPYECLAGWQADKALGVIQLDPGAGQLSFFRATGPTQTFPHEGTDVTLLEPVRATDGSLLPGVRIDPDPAWSVTLSHKNKDEWRPLLTPLVRLTDASSGFRSPVTNDGRIEVTMTTTMSRDQQKEIQESMRGKGRPVLDYSRFIFGFDSPSS
jgi:hypothetical protein